MMVIKDRFEARIQSLMADPEPAHPLSTAGLLQGAARLFGLLTRFRSWGYRSGLLKTHRLPCIVISIGNITSGGTGKTPMTLYIAKLLQHLGYSVAILSRGYKGSSEKRGGVVSDGENLLMTPGTAGDEPFMMARFLENIPVLVGRDRVASGHLAVSQFSPDILLLDDGFQHRRLHRNIDIVLLDSTQPFGNRFLVPRGSLREPLEALVRADAIVFTRCHAGLPDPATLLPNSIGNHPIFRSRNIPYIHKTLNPLSKSIQTPEMKQAADLKGARVLAFSAIADNRDFHRVLADLGCQITGTFEFADHHAYSIHELETICLKASESDAQLLITTHKDFHKLPHYTRWPLPLMVIGVLPSFFEGELTFDEFIAKTVYKKERALGGD